MKKQAPLKIKITTPCVQQWDKMPEYSEGRSCAACNKTIVDFSAMTDAELFNYFKINPHTHCGRFHNSQLNRTITPQSNKKFTLHRLNKIAAAFFTFLSLKSFSNNKLPALSPTEQNAAVRPETANTSATKTSITGTVTDESNKPIKGAQIVFDSNSVAVTDENGNYSFVLNEVSAGSHTLYFNYDGYISVVRTYQTAMASTQFNVVLQKPGQGYHTMGIMIMPAIDLPSLVFKRAVVKLNRDQKTMLAVAAKKLRENPGVSIEIIGFPEMHGPRRFDNLYRLENIKKYLVEKEGINAARITTNLEVGGGDYNTIDIKQPDN